MSKTFTERRTAQEKSDHNIPLMASITPDGNLRLPDDYIVRPTEARRFAMWILGALKATAP